jgi:hypothetical protein
MPEVQSAMASQAPALAAKLSNGSWMTPELMQRIAAEPRLVAGMQQPRFLAALKEMEKDPAGTLKRYAGDRALEEFLRCYMGILGDHFQKLGKAEDAQARASGGGSGDGGGGGGGIGLTPVASKQKAAKPPTPAEVAAAAGKVEGADEDVKKALANPKVVELLSDPEVQAMMRECSQAPEALKKYLRMPSMREKIRSMEQLGLIRIE